MGKVYRHLYDQVCDWENLLLAWRKARKGKRGYAPAALPAEFAPPGANSEPLPTCP